MPLLTHTPAAIGHDGALPRFTYSLSTEDDERNLELAIDRGGEISVVADSGWSHVDHDRHTVGALLTVQWPEGMRETLQLTGHQHRELEDRELFGSLLQGIAWGNPPVEALSHVLPPQRRAA